MGFLFRRLTNLVALLIESARIAEGAYRKSGRRLVVLTEVHVPKPAPPQLSSKKLIWRGFCNPVPYASNPAGKSKYHGNWYGNRLGLTICVNTKTLLSSHSHKRRLVQMPVMLPGIVPLGG
jgi:hypothetical protein